MTIDEIRKLVADIATVADDDEAAHVLEDALYLRFIRYVCEAGCERDARLAKEVLKAERIDFARYYS